MPTVCRVPCLPDCLPPVCSLSRAGRIMFAACYLHISASELSLNVESEVPSVFDPLYRINKEKETRDPPKWKITKAIAAAAQIRLPDTTITAGKNIRATTAKKAGTRIQCFCDSCRSRGMAAVILANTTIIMFCFMIAR